MPRIKDTDYLSISARVRAKENRLLTRERMERMIDARATEDAVKILVECGYQEMTSMTASALDEMLVKASGAIFDDLRFGLPNPAILDIFRIKNDYHNVKVLMKSEPMNTQPERLLMAGGRYPADALADAYRRDDLRNYSETFRKAVTEAKELLASSGDPQLSDFVLDRAYFAEMRVLAQATDSQFLIGYVRLCIDTANLRSCVRAARMGKGAEFLSQVLLPGGSVDEKSLATGKSGGIESAFRTGALSEAAALGATLAAPGGGSLTAFERMCDDAVMHYITTAKRIPFGEQPIVGYLYAREMEFTAIRTILSGRMAGLSAERIRERLREAYV
ncbi:MAG: V-type ATPase subunit [Oscillospiraceae bacterium]|nr:V-type ATPase subunit [Oscillospiraceae bacterium]